MASDAGGGYNTPTGEHPDLVRLREQEAAAIALGYTEGDVNHYVQPITGMLRLRLHNGQPISTEDAERAIEALQRACQAEIAWLAMQRETEATR